MMSTVEILSLSVALAMDCFTVSIVSGLILKQHHWGIVVWTAFLFGFFQSIMPLLGWIAASRFQSYIEAYDHWVAFTLLSYLGCSMIREAFQPEEVPHFNPARLGTQLLQAIATSIDALAVGISMSMIGYEQMDQLLLPLSVIGIGSFLFSIAGFLTAFYLNGKLHGRLKPELLGGVILLLIGFKILLSQL